MIFLRSWQAKATKRVRCNLSEKKIIHPQSTSYRQYSLLILQNKGKGRGTVQFAVDGSNLTDSPSNRIGITAWPSDACNQGPSSQAWLFSENFPMYIIQQKVRNCQHPYLTFRSLPFLQLRPRKRVPGCCAVPTLRSAFHLLLSILTLKNPFNPAKRTADLKSLFDF